MGIFSWEQLLGEGEVTGPQDGFEGTPQLHPSREDGSILQSGSRSRQESDPWAPQSYSQAPPSNQHNVAYPAEISSPHTSPDTWLPPVTSARRQYGNTIPEQDHFHTGNAPEMDLQAFEPLYDHNPTSMDASSVAAAPLMPPPKSFRDTSDVDPRIMSPQTPTSHNWHLAKPASSAHTGFANDNPEISDSGQSAAPSEASEPRSHDFVMEKFDTASGSMESRRGRRRGKLSESSASSAGRMRTVGACWKCRLLKNQCSIGDPCGPCRKVLEAKRYCQPCYRGSLLDLAQEFFWNEDPKPGSTALESFSKALLPGARTFLAAVKRKENEVLRLAVKLYESDDASEMSKLLYSVLRKVDSYLSHISKHLPQAEFFAICVLDMVSRASEIAGNEALSDHDDMQATTYPSPVVYLRKSKTLEVLFGLVRSSKEYSPFEVISEATGGKAHDRLNDGMDLHTHVESCLFNIKPAPTPLPQSIESLQMHPPLEANESPVGPVMRLPDRSMPSVGHKRGSPAGIGSREPGARAGSGQRLPAATPRKSGDKALRGSHSGGKG